MKSTNSNNNKSNSRHRRRRRGHNEITPPPPPVTTTNKRQHVQQPQQPINNNNNQPTKQYSSLQQKFRSNLQGSKFRMLNETLYESNSSVALQTLSKQDFNTYHEGFRTQVSKWPQNPVNVIIDKYLKNCPRGLQVGDFGCGDAQIAQQMGSRHHIYSFDFISTSPTVVRCDIAHVPLEDHVLDIAIYSLSLMGKNMNDFLLEAARVLKLNSGKLIIAEVKSRFVVVQEGEEDHDDVSTHNNNDNKLQMQSGIEKFKTHICNLGFRFVESDLRNTMFVILVFERIPQEEEVSGPKQHRQNKSSDTLLLKSIPYKRR
jgi:ribosomal RNA-processing protein 8